MSESKANFATLDKEDNLQCLCSNEARCGPYTKHQRWSIQTG